LGRRDVHLIHGGGREKMPTQIVPDALQPRRYRDAHGLIRNQPGQQGIDRLEPGSR
jgi:hypothetical protein